MRWWLLVCVGCGTSNGVGPPPTETAVNGTVSGMTFTIASAASAKQTDTTGGTAAFIELTSAADACGDATARIRRANAQYIKLEALNLANNTATAPTAPGDYQIRSGLSGPTASVLVEANDATCQSALSPQAYAMRGTVTIAAIDTDYYAGRFDVTLATGDHLTGSFVPEPCPALATETGTTCM